MTTLHDEVEIEDFDYDEVRITSLACLFIPTRPAHRRLLQESETFSYPCPCGDLFKITKEELEDGEDIARCASCSLIVRVIYDEDDFEAASDGGDDVSTIPEPAAEPVSA